VQEDGKASPVPKRFDPQCRSSLTEKNDLLDACRMYRAENAVAILEKGGICCEEDAQTYNPCARGRIMPDVSCNDEDEGPVTGTPHRGSTFPPAGENKKATAAGRFFCQRANDQLFQLRTRSS
jgi:hypothetical protein